MRWGEAGSTAVYFRPVFPDIAIVCLTLSKITLLFVVGQTSSGVDIGKRTEKQVCRMHGACSGTWLGRYSVSCPFSAVDL